MAATQNYEVEATLAPINRKMAYGNTCWKRV
jgi:hypothetical protein